MKSLFFKKKHFFCLCLILISSICRDGVSEGQFSQVLLYEMDAIRKVSQAKSFLFRLPIYPYIVVSPSHAADNTMLFLLVFVGMC